MVHIAIWYYIHSMSVYKKKESAGEDVESEGSKTHSIYR